MFDLQNVLALGDLLQMMDGAVRSVLALVSCGKKEAKHEKDLTKNILTCVKNGKFYKGLHHEKVYYVLFYLFFIFLQIIPSKLCLIYNLD